MKKLRYGIAALACLSIISVLFVSSCKSKPKPSDSNSVSAANENPEQRRPIDKVINLPDANEVAATVNGVDIKEGEVQEIIAPEIERINEVSSTQNVRPEILRAYMSQISDQALQQLIVQCLLIPKVKEANIVVTKEEAENLIVERLHIQAPSLTLDDFKKTLVERGKNYDEVVQKLRDGLACEKFVDAQIVDEVNVSDEEARKFYDDNPKAFDIPEQVRASHILVQCDPNEPNEVKQVAKEKIEGLLKKVKDGADFAELAKETGGFPSAPKGGDLGYFRRGDMTGPFEDAAFSLAPGQVSDVVETQFGYHIIKVTDHKDASVLTFDEAKNSILEHLKSQKEDEAAGKFYESLIKEATIKFPAGKELKTGLFAAKED